MSGHSKWATIKHKKGAADKARGKLFAKLIRQVEVAAREGGGDPDANPTLRTMFQKARDASVPLDTIERAIKRGTGELEGVTLRAGDLRGLRARRRRRAASRCSPTTATAPAPTSAACSRRNGGSLAEPGAVAWQFERKGVIIVDRSADEDDLMLAALDAGAEDIVDEGDTWRVPRPPSDLQRGARTRSRQAASTSSPPTSTMLPTTTVPLDDGRGRPSRCCGLIDALDDHDDVQGVYANFDIPDSILEAVEA